MKKILVFVLVYSQVLGFAAAQHAAESNYLDNLKKELVAKWIQTDQ